MSANQHPTSTPAFASNASDLSSRVASRADKAIDITQRVTDTAAQSLHSGLNTLRDEVPFTLSKAGASADALIAEGKERAKEASAVMRSKTDQMQRQVSAYVREKPVTSLLLVAGVASVLTLLLSGSSGRRR